MKLTILLIACTMFLSGCGQEREVDITYHEVTPAELEEMAPDNQGYVVWFPDGSCDIYMLPEWMYEPLYCDGAFQAVKEHEEKHCTDGDWHDDSHTIDVCEFIEGNG